ncbi:MAG: hypothetical protein JW839_15440 [Candidatus Lokiarchaeota archaeon]|nr:hypothetical protein [Candidatus Lokiarchaeota archaeon]
MRTRRDIAARVGKALLPSMTIAFVLALVLVAAGSRHVNQDQAVVEGGVRPSGSYNTRIYLTSINTYTQVQGGYFVLRGYVEVANVSDPPNWDPWPDVAVALRMNDMFIHQTPAPGDIVQTTTNGTGNFTLSYQVTFNHTVGDWTITAGIAPIPSYNYTYDPLFGGTAPYNVNVTANVDVPQPLQYAPAAVFTNDVFTISGRLLTAGGFPATNVAVQASFNNTANYTSSLTNGTGHFTIDVDPAVNNYYNSLVLHVPKTGFYNAGSFPVPGFIFLDSVTHYFSGDVAASTTANPTPVNSTITISGRFTYNGSAFGGDGNVKNKPVRVYWDGALIGTPTTDAQGQYQLPYSISSSEPTGLPYTTLPVDVSLDAPVAGQNDSTPFFIRPMIGTRLTVTPRPAWKDEPVVIRGILSEDEAPAYLRVVSGVTVSVALWDGAVMVGSTTAVTNSTGGFVATLPAQDLDALNFTVAFPAQGPHAACGAGGAVPLYKTAAFVFDSTMASWSYAGPPYSIHVSGRAYAQGFGLPDKPIQSRQVNVYWNGKFTGLEALDGSGYFSFDNATTFDTPTGLYVITLQLADFNQTGYSVSSSRAIQIRPLQDIDITVNPCITNPIFPDEGLHVDGSLGQRAGGLEIVAFLTYENITLRYENSMMTEASGAFHFVIDAAFVVDEGWIGGSLISIRLLVNEGQLDGYKSATTANHTISFIDPYHPPSAVDFAGVSIGSLPAASVGSVEAGTTVTISGTMLSHLGAPVSFYRVQVVDPSTGTTLGSGTTGADGSFSIDVLVAGSPGSGFAFSLRTDYNGVVFYTSAAYSVPIVAASQSSWILWLIPPVAVGLVLLGLVYVRIQKKQVVARIRSYMQQKLDMVRLLVAAGKNRESVAYCYHALVEVATRAYNLDDVKESETVREFIEMLVNEKNVPREVAFMFMVAVLDGLYSNQAITQDHVATTVGLLGKLYADITKDTQETFTL